MVHTDLFVSLADFVAFLFFSWEKACVCAWMDLFVSLADLVAFYSSHGKRHVCMDLFWQPQFRKQK
jgi:hypothetical protein